MNQQTKKRMAVRPLGNRVLVRRLEGQETLKGGILLPETAKKKQEIAEVIAVGKGKLTEGGEVLPIPLRVGERVLVNEYAGQEVSIEDEEYVILRFDDIIAVVEK